MMKVNKCWGRRAANRAGWEQPRHRRSRRYFCSLTQLSVTSDDSVEQKHTYLSGIVSKTGSIILYQIPADIALRQPVVLGWAGKATRKSKYW